MEAAQEEENGPTRNRHSGGRHCRHNTFKMCFYYFLRSRRVPKAINVDNHMQSYI
jgi:hypothetical protein